MVFKKLKLLRKGHVIIKTVGKEAIVLFRKEAKVDIWEDRAFISPSRFSNTEFTAANMFIDVDQKNKKFITLI